ncbi:MAG: SDR family oxidoreductase [Polaromonas sp.]|jgi:NAD(P)-dependent dehydrogenase (short-subunit alcohol dehydrogenase family)|uniref:SDR family NAD(P)-dependent oxidoreductase n=1 Tax=Polaromonas sp. TaxID=1869339 RepID=UPI0025ED0992|nr:SDR family NAD(P)-dependent oxidoreductase [Polaromonas sp.]MBI2726336.1 SDR family oxidoreductase [Polaromonas sp.]
MRALIGRTAIVCGAGAIGPGWGNGKATAVAFARAGAKVLAADVSADSARETQEIILSEGGNCEIFAGDLSDSASVEKMVAVCLSHFGSVDILHNNIGVMFPGDVVSLEEKDWDLASRLNIKTLFLSCKHVIPVMLSQGFGVITNVGSISASRYLGMPAIAYSTTKGAVHSFTSALAAQYGRQGIRVNTITPGIVDTPTLEHASAKIAEALQISDIASARAARENSVPLGRFGTAWDVANAAVFLASDQASYITGTDLLVDGGLSCVAPRS